MSKMKQEKSMIENFDHLKSMILGVEADVRKNAEKGNYVAGQRFRKVIKETKHLLTVLRKQSIESGNKKKEN